MSKKQKTNVFNTIGNSLQQLQNDITDKYNNLNQQVQNKYQEVSDSYDKALENIMPFSLKSNAVPNNPPVQTTNKTQSNPSWLPKFDEIADRIEIKQNAIKRANRKMPKGQYNATADLQDGLWKVGAFDGIQDNAGKSFTYAKSVDGIMGKRTRQAIENARKMGFEVDESTGQISGNAKKIHDNMLSFNIGNIINGQKKAAAKAKQEEEQKSQMGIVLDHRKKNRVRGTAWYFDLGENVGYRIVNGEVKDTFNMMSGLNRTSDGYVPLYEGDPGGDPYMSRYRRDKNLMSTPAGIFTMGDVEPLMAVPDDDRRGTNLYLGLEPLNTSFHDNKTGSGRDKNTTKYSAKERSRTFGCITPTREYMDYLIKNKLIHDGDAVYIQPKLEGNSFQEDAYGNLRTIFNNAPTSASGKNWGDSYSFDNVLYNNNYIDDRKGILDKIADLLYGKDLLDSLYNIEGRQAK